MGFNRYFEELAAKTSTPGGGSIAALTGAGAASLMVMVLHYSIKKNNSVEINTLLQKSLAHMYELKNKLLICERKDIILYKNLREAYKKKDPRSIIAATDEGLHLLYEVMSADFDILLAAEEYKDTCNKNLLSDLLCVIHLATASAKCELDLMEANIKSLTDAPEYDELISRWTSSVSDWRSYLANIVQHDS